MFVAISAAGFSLRAECVPCTNQVVHAPSKTPTPIRTTFFHVEFIPVDFSFSLKLSGTVVRFFGILLVMGDLGDLRCKCCPTWRLTSPLYCFRVNFIRNQSLWQAFQKP